MERRKKFGAEDLARLCEIFFCKSQWLDERQDSEVFVVLSSFVCSWVSVWKFVVDEYEWVVGMGDVVGVG